MTVIFSQQQKKQKYLIIVFVIVLVVTSVIVWWGFFKKEKVASLKVTSVPAPQEIKINFDLLGGEFLKNIQEPKTILPLEGSSGRANPFLSY